MSKAFTKIFDIFESYFRGVRGFCKAHIRFLIRVLPETAVRVSILFSQAGRYAKNVTLPKRKRPFLLVEAGSSGVAEFMSSATHNFPYAVRLFHTLVAEVAANINSFLCFSLFSHPFPGVAYFDNTRELETTATSAIQIAKSVDIYVEKTGVCTVSPIIISAISQF